MKDYLKIKGIPFEYEKIDLELDNVPVITYDQARNTIFLADKLLKEKGITYSLIYGTLLGAIREKGFISHDYDVDIFTSQQEDLLDAIPDFYQKGLRLCRVVENRLYSFMTDNGAYIDIYIMKKAPIILNLWCYSLNGNIVPKKYLSEFETIDFLGGKFKVPKEPERLIRFFYGKTWRTPIKGAHGRYDIYPVWLYRSIKKWLKKIIQ